MTVACIIDVLEAELAKQGADDTDHGREIIHHEHSEGMINRHCDFSRVDRGKI